MTFTATQRAIIRETMEAQGIPGLAAAIVKGDEILAAEAFGYRDLEDKLPMTTGTVMPIASLSKSFTATAIMQLVEEGKLRLDDPIARYLPDFRFADETASRSITPRMLLCHKSGIGRTGHQTRVLEEPERVHYRGRADLVSRLAEVQLQTPPNEAWSYSNEGYAVLGLLVDTLSGSSLEEHLERRVFGPLGMTSTCSGFPKWRAMPDRAVGHLRQGARHARSRLPQDYTAYGAGGGVCTTVIDYARYLAASMDHDGTAILAGGFLDQMQTVSMPYGDTGWGYGFGWQVSWSGPRKVVHHGGGLPGHSTYAMILPWERLGVAVLTNASPAKPRELAERLLSDALDAPLFRPNVDDPLPIRTKYPAPDAETLVEYAGAYEHENVRLMVDTTPPDLTLTIPSPDGVTESASAVAVGRDLFMGWQQGDLLRFLRGDDGWVVALLTGGVCYSRVL
jgi:D-alanyl-D-alanine carboxypeptidase